MELRDYQLHNVSRATEFLRSAVTGDRRLYAAPCGTGKSVCQIKVQENLGPTCYIVTPKVEIRGQMEEKGGDPECIKTPVTLLNRLMDGTVRPPDFLIFDEGHHGTAETYAQIRLCCGYPPEVAYTATPFRGTPQGTHALRSLYGEPEWIIRLTEAVDRGLVSLPECTTVPVLDDDVVELSNGEFKVRSIERRTPWASAVDLVRRVWGSDANLRQPTVVSMPGVWSCRELAEHLGREGIECDVISADTKRRDRVAAFQRCMSCASILLQIHVVGEGVDFPFRNLIDLAPTMSPVDWLQRIGRIMRPGGRSKYVCANRNLLRHGYLLEGLLPVHAVAQAQTEFVTPSRRVGIRAFGLEGVGRLKPTPVPLANGLQGYAYYVSRAENHRTEQYVAIVLPNTAEPLWAQRHNQWEGEQYAYGKWVRCDSPSELTGFASVPPRPLTERMENRWRQSAKHFGLNESADIDSKQFQVLPVLMNIGAKIQ